MKTTSISIRNTKKIPKLRFREFSGDLKTLQFDDYLKSISSGKSSSRNVSKNKYLFYGSTGVIGHTDNAEYVGKKILIARVGANAGSIYCANGQYAVSDNTLVVELQPGINTDFIFYYLKKNNLRRMVFGSGQPLVTGGQIKKILITLPNKEEQQKVAEFLTSVDELIELQDKKVKLLQKYKKGIMQKIFSQQIRFKDDNGKEYPSWQEKKLGEVLIKNSNKNKGALHKLVQSVSNTSGFINQTDLFKDHVIASKDLSNYYVIKKGSFAYNPSRIDVGSLAYKSDSYTSVVSPLYVCFNANNTELYDIYLLNWFDTGDFKRQMQNSFEGSVRNTLSYDSLKRMKILIPKLQEQQKIAEFSTSIDDKIELEKVKLKQARQFKKALLQRMFV